MDWQAVHEFWFPAQLAEGDLDFCMRTSEWWMRGGAGKELGRFEPVLEAAAAGRLDFWCETARGRLSLIIVMDQFSRSLWAGTPRAFSLDQRALALCQEGIEKGHLDELEYHAEFLFFTLPMLHAEGPDHRERLERLVRLCESWNAAALARYPALRPLIEFSADQTRANLDVISRYGRFPHRNAVLGRQSTEEERAYIERGDFVHQRPFPKV